MSNDASSSRIPPLRAPDPGDASACDVATALLGDPAIKLSGFSDKTARRSSWRHPAAPFVAAAKYEEMLPVVQSKIRFWSRVGTMFIAASFLCVGLAGGIFAGVYAAEWMRPPPPNGGAWKMVAVLREGVVIQFGESRSLIPTGGRLPNGDQILSVSAQASTVITASATILVREEKDEK